MREELEGFAWLVKLWKWLWAARCVVSRVTVDDWWSALGRRWKAMMWPPVGWHYGFIARPHLGKLHAHPATPGTLQKKERNGNRKDIGEIPRSCRKQCACNFELTPQDAARGKVSGPGPGPGPSPLDSLRPWSALRLIIDRNVHRACQQSSQLATGNCPVNSRTLR